MRIVLLVILFLACSQSVQAQNKSFIFWSVILQGTTIYDVETSFAALKNCPNCEEGNPLAEFVVSRGKPLTYAIVTGINAGMMYFAWTKKDNKSWVIVPAVMSISHGVAGTINLRFIF